MFGSYLLYYLLYSMVFVSGVSFGDFFVVKQMTAYEMLISDWSSDVCSSDLFGVSKPGVPRSTMKPRISPSSLAQMIARSAIGALVIHVLPPLRTNPPATDRKSVV